MNPSFCPPIIVIHEHEKSLLDAVMKGHLDDTSESIVALRQSIAQRRGAPALTDDQFKDQQCLLSLHGLWLADGKQVYEADEGVMDALKANEWRLPGERAAPELGSGNALTCYALRFRPYLKGIVGAYVCICQYEVLVLPLLDANNRVGLSGRYFLAGDTSSDHDDTGDGKPLDPVGCEVWRVIYGLIISLSNRRIRTKPVQQWKQRCLLGRGRTTLNYRKLYLDPSVPLVIEEKKATEHQPEDQRHPHASPCLHAVREHQGLRWMREWDGEGELVESRFGPDGAYVGVLRTVRAHTRGRGQGDFTITRIVEDTNHGQP